MKYGTEPLTDIEARLAQPGGAQYLQELNQSLAEQTQALRRQMASGTLDREGFSRTQAYATAFEAATRFLGAAAIRSSEVNAVTGMKKE